MTISCALIQSSASATIRTAQLTSALRMTELAALTFSLAMAALTFQTTIVPVSGSPAVVTTNTTEEMYAVATLLILFPIPEYTNE